MEILFLFVGIGLGGLVMWLYLKSRKSQTSHEVENARSRIADAQERENLVREELNSERRLIVELNRQLATKETEYRGLLEKINDQKHELSVLQKSFAAEFKNLANEIFEEKSKRFTDQNKSNLSELLHPLKEKLTDFEKKVEQSNKDSIERSSALREQISSLKELNVQITREAENLTKALKGDTRSQGKWGEMVLENILEKSGLVKGREYFVQESFTSENGRRLQPDIVVGLPDEKNIIIDSKVTLTAFERYTNEENTEVKAKHLKDHLGAVRAHIKNLNGKNYQGLYGVKGLDFVLMFIPIEPAFSLAVQSDASLFHDAYEHNIVIVSPSTLIATLRTIANIWKNEYQNQNALEIAKQGGDLYDKFVGFSEDLIALGRQLDGTQKAYGEAMKKLTEGRGNLVSRAEKIRKLGAMPSKNIDKRLVDRSDEEG